MLTLERADLLQLEPISNRGTLKLLPLGKKNKQKLVVGDDSGQIGCYEFKKGEPQIVFQMKVFEGPITSVALGGGNPQKRDRIFLSHSQRIVGITKKGKEFFKLTSSLTETIQNIAVEDTRIWTGCEHIYNLYDNGKDLTYYVSKGQINDLTVSHLTKENEFDVILACQDKYIRIVHGSQLFLEIPVNNAVTVVCHLEMDNDMAPLANCPRHLIYGTVKGEIGLIEITSNATFEILWEIYDEEKKSEITSITTCDINKDYVPEIIVGRDDGRLEVFKLTPENLLVEPSLIFSKDIGQSIRSVVCGVVNTVDYVEVIVAAYSGKVISFTTEPVRARATEDSYGRSIQTVNNENRIRYLRKEVEELKKKVEKEREKVKKLNLPNTLGQASKVVPELAANTKFDIDSSLAAYVLQIELQSPLDLVVLQCPVVLDLVDTEQTGNAVLSVTPPHLQPMIQGGEGSNPCRYVAVFRCQSAERRISLSLRSNEGEYGDLIITIVAATSPKTAKVMKYELKPLSLHVKVHKLSTEEAERPRNRIRYTGAVNLSTIYEWIDALLPDMPSRLDEEASEQRHYFRNTFTTAVTVVEFRKNEIIIESESASTIAIAKETITRLANYRRLALEESVVASEEAVKSFLSLLRDKLDYQLLLSRKVLLVDAVQELAQLPPDFAASNPSGNDLPAVSGSWLSEEYQDILQNQEAIRKEFKTRSRSVEYLAGIVTDLFVDYHRLQGQDVKHRIAALQQHVMNMNMTSTSTEEYFNGIVKFFTT